MTCQPSPLRVLYVARAPFVSGAERALRSMLAGLDRRQVEPRVVLGYESSLLEDCRKLDVAAEVIPLPKRSLSGWFAWRRSLNGIQRVVRHFQPDILHANDVPSSQAVSLLGHRLSVGRVVHVRWTITAQEAAWWMPASTDALICISRYVQQKLGPLQGSPLATADVKVLPDAVDVSPAESLASSAVVPSGQRARLGFAGQLIESKGLELLIRALAQTPQSQRPELLIAGHDTQSGGAYQQHLVGLTRSLGVADDVRWLGFLQDVGQLYRQVDAVACPSLEEPLGLIPLEAAAYRKPSLANRLGGFLETIQHNRTGWLIEPTPQAWAQALAQLRDRLTLDQMGQAALARVRQEFAAAIHQRRLMEIYRSLKQAAR